MIDINEIKAARLLKHERLIREFMDEKIGDRDVYYLSGVTGHGEAIVVLDKNRIIYKIFSTSVIIDVEYLCKFYECVDSNNNDIECLFDEYRLVVKFLRLNKYRDVVDNHLIPEYRFHVDKDLTFFELIHLFP